MNYHRHSGNFNLKEDSFSQNASSMAMIMHGAFLILKFLQTKLQIEDKEK